ncbi:Phospholipase/Carboxylesterase [Rosistilla ulvae]|uniref:Phospholipase/Carboxylesterase n=1 Tax=Rosistilla ulvae TaxID=1930277 RepID=A0A517LXB2_9BACT|nr:lysophospholipase [Rosistilla ulvae]QDS87264.1 Phospholipase/Carboxylesterase [Rosistilla ulvae]
MSALEQKIGPLQCVVIDGGEAPTIPVVLCHGFGAPGDDLVPLGQYLLEMLGDDAEKFRFVFPTAPISLADQGMPGGRAWWPLNMQRLMELFQTNDFSELRRQEPPGIEEARQMLTETIEAVAGDFDKDAPLVIGGFSQGAMVSLDVALRGLKNPPAGLIQWSGTLICEAQWKAVAADRLKSVDALQSHGHSDFVLPMIGAQWLSELLDESSANFEFIQFDGPHTIPMESLQATAELLRRVAANAS